MINVEKTCLQQSKEENLCTENIFYSFLLRYAKRFGCTASEEGFEVLLVKLKGNWKDIYQEMLTFIKYWILQ